MSAVVTNVVEIVVEGIVTETGGTTKNIFNVFHYFQNPNLPGPPGAIAVANQFLTVVWGPIATQLSVGWVGNQTLCRYLDDVTFPFLTAGVPGSGAVALPRLPTQQAVVHLLRSSMRGKNFRGSKHFGPIPTADVTGDELNAAGVAAWNPINALLQGNITVAGQTFSPCVLSRSLSQLRTNPVTIQAATVTQVLLNKTIGTMRRRKEKTVR